MKRSTMLVLGAVAGAAVVGYTLFGGEDDSDVDASVFASVDSCVASGISKTDCVTRFEEAVRANVQSAPRFASREDCERDFGTGRCEAAPTAQSAAGQPAGQTQPAQTASTGTSYFMPMMMGFMAARMMSGGSQAAYPAQPVYGCSGSPAPTARPAGFPQQNSCYSNRYGQRYAFVGSAFAAGRTTTVPASSFRSSSANYVSRGSSVSSFRPSGTGSTVMARGGFGSSGRGYSGGG